MRLVHRNRDTGRAEKALRLSESQFRILIESVADYAIYMLDTDGRHDLDRGAERIKGYVAEEIIGQHFSRFYTADDRRKEIPQRALETAVREGQFRRKGGTRVMTLDLTDEETRALLNLLQDHATLWSSRSIGRQSTRWHGTAHWRCTR
jgi:PAS domain S-box-containing protein